MRCSEIIGRLDALAPERCACEWDNPGLLAGRRDKEVKRIYIALDATDQVVERAISQKADLLLTHHPLIFKAIKQVNDQNFITRRLVRLIQADISYYAMHTNFDAAPGCMADLAAARLGLKDCAPLELMGELHGQPYGIGKVGVLEQPMELERLAQRVKETFGLPFVLVYGQNRVTGPLSRAAVCPGAGGSVTETALTAAAQVLVTGDISHHQGLDCVARGMAIIDGGHYGLEHMFIDYMAGFLKEELGDGVELIKALPEWPAVIL